MPALATPHLDQLRADIRAALDTQGLAIADLARAIGKNYTQTFLWISGHTQPGGEITIQLQIWLAAHRAPSA